MTTCRRRLYEETGMTGLCGGVVDFEAACLRVNNCWENITPCRTCAHTRKGIGLRVKFKDS